ncbi:hypothetical protein [Vulcanisaeta distributa]|uniref:Zn-ribbon domain-containing OB-fold protein n=1 Tax=Vulcanisaeta distributa TaxID=164451 RepID=UPI001FB43CE6|nr:hypothetical protein [Vulcanisaeta distributa]
MFNMELNELLKEYDKIYESGQIPITQCRACGYKFHMPRTRCPPRCGSVNLTVIGYVEGTIYSYTIIERGGYRQGPSSLSRILMELRSRQITLVN